MGISTVIMFFTSVLFLFMGIGVFCSKTFKTLEKEKLRYAKINGIIYTFVGVSALILGVINYLNASKSIMLIFAFVIFIAALIQLVLAKTLQK